MFEKRESAFSSHAGSGGYALADWRKKVNDLYSQVRNMSDPEEAWRFWYFARSEMFRTHPMSPVSSKGKKRFKEIDVFDYNPNLRFSVDFSPSTSETLEFDLGEDGSFKALPHARTSGLEEYVGSELEVYWISGYVGGLFIPFKDKTSGTETYGGGRYLVDAIKGADLGLDRHGKVILDFNFAYNPSCSMSDAYVCPLSPSINELPVKILAGEKAQTRI